MLYKPTLLVRRLVVIKDGHHVYDEEFHIGVNVIRGKNSSGKSTIADFLFYGLGGELTKWKNEAKTCDFVFTEVALNENVFTLKREIDEKSRRGMDIFAGDFDTASTTNTERWLRYPYNATEKKESFYQALLKELGLPYSKSEDKNSITMHQLLRMMYVDQMTSPDRLFKFDQFDSSNKRQAIGELLMGVSDFSLYENRVRLIKLEAQLDARIKEIRTIHDFLGGSIKSLNEIDSEISEKLSTIQQLEEQVVDENSDPDDEIDENLVLLSEQIRELRNTKLELITNISSLNFEIIDSQMFIESLQSRLEALSDTSRTIDALSDINFSYCPACFSELDKKEFGCHLCGSEKREQNDDYDPTFKVRKEIEFQISESSYLMEARQKKLNFFETKLSQVQVDIEIAENEIATFQRPKIKITAGIRNTYKEIGALSKQIDDLNQSKDKYSKLYYSYQQRDALQTEVTRLKDEIARKQASQERALRNKKRYLSQQTINILRADQDHEEIFREGTKIDFDFSEDRVSIDDRVLFSASSMVYLKNAFRLSMLQASCNDNSYLYPRFLLMDNIEDKGMQPERSQLFQREIIKVSNSLSTAHQIIFTTSLIAPEIEGTEHCVGDYYTDQNKTLKFAKRQR